MRAARPCAVTVVVAAVAALGTTGCAKSPPAAQPPPDVGAEVVAVPATGPGGTGGSEAVGSAGALGVPSGFAPDEAGAVAAAVAYTRFASELLAMPTEDAVAARRAMATSAKAQAQAAEFAAQLATLREGWPPGALSYEVNPLATRVTTTDGTVAVDVWYVGVVSARGVDTYAEWVTDSYELRWEAGDWRIASLVETDGPTPAPAPQPMSSAAEIEARLVGFEPVDASGGQR